MQDSLLNLSIPVSLKDGNVVNVTLEELSDFYLTFKREIESCTLEEFSERIMVIRL